jgi:hypothetical protein
MASLMNAEVPFLADRVSRLGIGALQDFAGIMSDANVYFQGPTVDYYNGCKTIAKLH